MCFIILGCVVSQLVIFCWIFPGKMFNKHRSCTGHGVCSLWKGCSQPASLDLRLASPSLCFGECAHEFLLANTNPTTIIVCGKLTQGLDIPMT